MVAAGKPNQRDSNMLTCWRGSSRLRRRVDLVLGSGLAIYFVYQVSRFHLANLWPPRPQADAFAIFELSRRVWDKGYLSVEAFRPGVLNFIFPSPPSAVLIFKALSVAGPETFALVWLSLMAAGLVCTLRLCLVGDRLEYQSSWLLVGALALVVTDGPIIWDLRNWNCNLIYLGLVLGAYATTGRRPVFAGILLAISTSLRLYSFLVIMWLFVRGPRRAFIAAGAGLAALWLIWPILAFGPAGAHSIYLGWFDQLKVVSGSWGYSMPLNPARPPLVTLRGSLSALTRADPFGPETQILVRVMWSVWFAALAWYFSRALKTPAAAPSRAALADWIVLLLAPLPLSPWLEPYHAVPLVPAVIVCILVAMDDEVLERDRLIAFFILAVLLVERLNRVPRPLEGFDLFGRLLELVVVLALLRPRLESLSALEGAGSKASLSPRVGYP